MVPDETRPADVSPASRELDRRSRQQADVARLGVLALSGAPVSDLFGEALRSIKSYDPDNLFTIISHTFSKPFAPGLKLGYTAMPDDLLHAVLQQKGNHDFGSSNLNQYVLDRLLEKGDYYRHVDHLQGVYREKRDAMLAALENEFPAVTGTSWTRCSWRA